MNCLLCFKKKDDSLKSITFDSIEWNELNVGDIIEKHLWKMQDIFNNHSYVCQGCWQEVYNFHNFYINIEKAHKNLCKIIKSKIISDDVLSDEVDPSEHILIDSEAHLQLESMNLLLTEKNPLEICEQKNVKEESFIERNNIRNRRPLNKSVKRFKIEQNYLEMNEPDANEDEIGLKFNGVEKVDTEKESFLEKSNKRRRPVKKSRKETKTIDNNEIKQREDIKNQEKMPIKLKEAEKEDMKKVNGLEKSTKRKRSLRKSKKESKNISNNEINEPECNKNQDKTSIKLIEGDRDIFKIHCKQCNQSYNSKQSFNNHMRIVHSENLCDLCGKILKNTYRLKLHLLEHEGKITKKKVICKVCGRILSDMGCLNRHMRSRHPPNGIKPELNCPVCNKIFTTNNNLKSHISSVHENKYARECTLCGKTFKKPNALKDHMSFHTGQPLHACSFCPKTFHSNSNMHTHRKRDHPKQWKESLKKFYVNLPEEHDIKTVES